MLETRRLTELDNNVFVNFYNAVTVNANVDPIPLINFSVNVCFAGFKVSDWMFKIFNLSDNIGKSLNLC